MIKITEDNELWLLIDDSFNIKKSETVHPETAKQDLEKLTAHFKHIRETKGLEILAAHVSRTTHPGNSRIVIDIYDNHVDITAMSNPLKHGVHNMPLAQLRNIEKNIGILKYFFPGCKEVE